MADVADGHAETKERNARPRSSDVQKVASAVAVAAALAGMVGAFSQLLSEKSNIFLSSDKSVAASRKQLDSEVVHQLQLLRTDVSALQRTQVQIARLPASDRAKIQINALANRVDALERSEQRLEQAILNNPEKALTIPLMRRDIDNMKDSNVQNLSAIKQSVDQVYDLTKWLLGGLAVGVFSLAIANFLTKK